MAWRGLNAGSYTPLPLLVCPQHRLLSRNLRMCRFYQAGAAIRLRRPPSAQSPFAQLGCYLRWGDVIRLLRGHYSSVVAHTGSCAAPVGLSPPSAFGLVWRVLAGCYQSLLPTAASRRYLQQSFLGCWIPYPGGTPCACACFFHGVIGLPHRKMGRLPASIPLETTSCEGGISRLQIFRYVPASKFARPPDRPYRCEYSRRAAGAFTSEQNAVRYLPAHRIC
jgi:hypothetical protein